MACRCQQDSTAAQDASIQREEIQPSRRRLLGALGALGVSGYKEKPGGTGDENRKYWCPLFERYGGDAVLEHHDHTFKRTHPLKDGLADKNGVLYLGDGSWGKIRPPKAAEKKPYLAAASQSYHLSLHRLEGEQRFHVALEETGKIVDICMSGKKPRKRG